MEVFEDRVPLAARQLLNRCRAGSHGWFQGTRVTKLIPEQGIFLTASRCITCYSEQRAA